MKNRDTIHITEVMQEFEAVLNGLDAQFVEGKIDLRGYGFAKTGATALFGRIGIRLGLTSKDELMALVKDVREEERA